MRHNLKADDERLGIAINSSTEVPDILAFGKATNSSLREVV